MAAPRTRRILLGFTAVVAVSACSASAPPGAAPRPGALSGAEIEALYRARTDSLRARFTEADVHFMAGMIGHHAQALVMAAMAPTHGASPAVRTLAARIHASQQDEIATMQQWLRERGQTVPEIHIEGTTLMVHGHDHAMHMPGMLADEQMRALDRARGAEFDRLFLTSMIQHHRGAVVMVRDLFATDGAAQDHTVFKFASDVQADQMVEINRMERMLLALPAPRRVP